VRVIALDEVAQLVNHHVADQVAVQEQQFAVQADAPTSCTATPAGTLVPDGDSGRLLPTLRCHALKPGWQRLSGSAGQPSAQRRVAGLNVVDGAEDHDAAWSIRSQQFSFQIPWYWVVRVRTVG